MVNNFESWRKATQERYSQCLDMYYVRVSQEVCRSVCNVLQKLLAQRVNNGSKHVSLYLTDGLANNMLDFLDQVEFAYMHPRSTSARIHFLKKEREAHQTVLTPQRITPKSIES